jgi:hypothetical protein
MKRRRGACSPRQLRKRNKRSRRCPAISGSPWGSLPCLRFPGGAEPIGPTTLPALRVSSAEHPTYFPSPWRHSTAPRLQERNLGAGNSISQPFGSLRRLNCRLVVFLCVPARFGPWPSAVGSRDRPEWVHAASVGSGLTLGPAHPTYARSHPFLASSTVNLRSIFGELEHLADLRQHDVTSAVSTPTKAASQSLPSRLPSDSWSRNCRSPARACRRAPDR